MLSNWGLSPLVPILKNATADGRTLLSLESAADVLNLAPLAGNLIVGAKGKKLSAAELVAMAEEGSVVSRLVTKVGSVVVVVVVVVRMLHNVEWLGSEFFLLQIAACRENDGLLSRSISIMMQNMYAHRSFHARQFPIVCRQQQLTHTATNAMLWLFVSCETQGWVHQRQKGKAKG